MTDGRQGVIRSPEGLPREDFGDPANRDLSWVTLFSAERTATDTLSAGVATIVPGGPGLVPHRHRQAEVYYIVDGVGLMTIEGVDTRVTPGTAVFIPGDAEHGIRAIEGTTLRLFYVFPADRFDEVVYRFPPYEAEAG